MFNQFHKHPDTKAIQAAGTVLADHIAASPKPEDAMSNAHWDLLMFSYQHPQSIDYALRVYDHACRLMPADLKSNYNNCTGEEAARKNLGMFFIYIVWSHQPLRGALRGGRVPRGAELGLRRARVR